MMVASTVIDNAMDRKLVVVKHLKWRDIQLNIIMNLILKSMGIKFDNNYI